MADRTLHGNGEDCPACALTREALDMPRGLSAAVPCNLCGGSGRVARPEGDIVSEAAALARRLYWPACEARWAAENAEGAVVAPAPSPWPPAPCLWVQLPLPF